MSAMYLGLYDEIDPTTALVESIQDMLSPSSLSIWATAKIKSPLLEPTNAEFVSKYPHWKYFVAEIQQYAKGKTQVISASHTYWLSSST
jgi:hypothetical protein